MERRFRPHPRRNRSSLPIEGRVFQLVNSHRGGDFFHSRRKWPWHGDAVGQTNNQTGDRDLQGNFLMFQIAQAGRQQKAEKHRLGAPGGPSLGGNHTPLQRVPMVAPPTDPADIGHHLQKKQSGEPQAGDQLHQQIPNGKRLAAPVAASSQAQVTDHRQVGVPGQTLEARSATGRRPDDRLLIGQPDRRDIEKTSSGKA